MRQAGYRVGIFTSPHLYDFRERIRVNGRKISKDYIARFIRKYRQVIDRNQITFFEVCTALAFCYFAERKVDLAVVEVGLGGRLDATNTLRPELSIITDINFDHTNILGRTLKKIAYEKAGIVKKDVPVLVGNMKSEPRHEIRRICLNRSAPLIYQRNDLISPNTGLFKFNYGGRNLVMKNLAASLPGRHQVSNAGLAVHAVELLNENGFKIGKRNIRSGLRKTVWKGRFQIIKKQKRPTVILDVGHNPSGVKAMAECFRQMYPGRRAHIIAGFVRFKSLDKIIKYLIPIARHIEIARLKSPRGTDPRDIARIFAGKKFFVSISDSLADSARRMIRAADRDDIIIICGSHFAVGEFLEERKKIL
jgi:dihydrofolate synthase/folylpolyglutamate synthase